MAAGDPTESVSEIFVPVDGDYAVSILERIFGSTVSSLIGSSDPVAGKAILTTVIGTFNVAVLFFATVVAAYLMYQLFLDTARDGEAGGRETNLAVTTLRAAGGAALLLPVSSGFSVIQILVLQLLLWGSGLGDYVWKEVATQMTTSATYTASNTNNADTFMTAKKMSSVLATRTAGFLCRLHMNKISNTLGTGEPVAPVGPETVKTYVRGDDGKFYDGSVVWYFSSGDAYSSRNELCGSVKLVGSPMPTTSTVDTSVYESTKTFAEDLTNLTNSTVRGKAITAVQNLDITAQAIAQSIFAGERNTAKIQADIAKAVADQTMNYITGVDNAVFVSAEASGMNQLKTSFLEATTDNGWMFAATWQRALAAYVTKLNNARNQLSFINSTEMDPKAAATSFLGWISGYNNTEERLFASADADFGYFQTFEGAFLEAGEPNASEKTTLEKVAANNQERSSMATMQWMYSVMFSHAKAGGSDADQNQWNDPLIEIQELGQTAILAAGVTIVVAAGTDLVGTGLGLASLASGSFLTAAGGFAMSYTAEVIGYLGYGLMVLGMILAIMLPFLPFVYFLSGAIGWVIMAIEAVIAAPLWILLTFAPHKSGDIIGTNKQGLLLMIGVFFRPVLMILGLLACFLVMRVGLDFINIMFSGIYMIIAPDFDLTNMFLGFGLLVMYVLTLIALVTNCCAIITGLGDAVMEFIGVRVSILGANAIASQVEGALNPVGRGAQAGIGMGENSTAGLQKRLGSATASKAGSASGATITKFLNRKGGGNGGKAG